jgi:hypothetical protein
LLLQGGNRHHALVRVVQVAAGFVGLHLACALHEHARDYLKAVCHAMLEFLKKNSLFPQQIVLEFLCNARIRYIRHRH